MAVLTGCFVAAYTTWDAYGIRLAENPFTFLAWFFLVASLDFPFISYARYRRLADPPPAWPILKRGLQGAEHRFHQGRPPGAADGLGLGADAGSCAARGGIG